MVEERQALKYYFGAETAGILGNAIQRVYPAFDTPGYVAAVAKGTEGLELKPRVLVMAAELRERLPADYKQAVQILVDSLGPEISDQGGMFIEGWYLMPVARFVEEYGLDHFEASILALREITRRHTAEYAIRPYIVRYPEQTMAYLHEWTRHESPHVRRLVSEGTRPRLPWASRLEMFVRDPRPALALLEPLKDDPSVYVQKSVANHLNDVTKDHPELVLETVERWLSGEPSERTSWIVRHALRTLIKAGDPRALAVLGSSGSDHVELSTLSLTPQAVRIGDSVNFSFELRNTDERQHMVNVDYLIHLARQNGRSNAKVFKLANIALGPGETKQIRKNHSFQIARVRRYYPGPHRLEIQVNGAVLSGVDFELIA